MDLHKRDERLMPAYNQRVIGVDWLRLLLSGLW